MYSCLSVRSKKPLSFADIDHSVPRCIVEAFSFFFCEYNLAVFVKFQPIKFRISMYLRNFNLKVPPRLFPLQLGIQTEAKNKGWEDIKERKKKHNKTFKPEHMWKSQHVSDNKGRPLHTFPGTVLSGVCSAVLPPWVQAAGCLLWAQNQGSTCQKDVRGPEV